MQNSLILIYWFWRKILCITLLMMFYFSFPPDHQCNLSILHLLINGLIFSSRYLSTLCKRGMNARAWYDKDFKLSFPCKWKYTLYRYIGPFLATCLSLLMKRTWCDITSINFNKKCFIRINQSYYWKSI